MQASTLRLAVALLAASCCDALRVAVQSREASSGNSSQQLPWNLWHDAAPVGPVEGLWQDGSWASTEARRLARTELAGCIRPELEPDLEGPTPWLDELRAAVEATSPPAAEAPHLQSVWRPIAVVEQAMQNVIGAGPAHFMNMKALPWHRAMVLTSNRSTTVPDGMDYEDSRCFLFDYQAAPGSVPDPHGCGLFRRSFSRLKTLRACIVEELKLSPVWRVYRHVVGAKVAESLTDLRFSLREEHTKIDLEELIEEVKKNLTDVRFDAYFRADEMVKYVSFKDWTEMGKGIINLANRKIAETITGITLEHNVVDRLREGCFSINRDSYAELPKETKTLKRALPCQALMWDSSEVGGNPHKPMSNAATLWDKSHRVPTAVKAEFANTPPVCGRIALALMQRPLIRAPKRYSPSKCLVGQTTWSQCLSLSHFNCICAEKCWVSALKRVCNMSPGCCGDYDKERNYDRVIPMPSLHLPAQTILNETILDIPDIPFDM